MKHIIYNKNLKHHPTQLDDINSISISNNENPFLIMSNFKNSYELHLLAHGSPGHLDLGTGINTEALYENAEYLSKLNVQKIILWGCNIGKDIQFIKTFSNLTNSIIYSSKDYLGKNKGMSDNEFYAMNDFVKSLPFYLHGNKKPIPQHEIEDLRKKWDITTTSSLNFELLDNHLDLGNNDCWGYTSPGGIKYALMSVTDKLIILRIVNNKFVKVGYVPHGASGWGDVKTYEKYCYVVTDVEAAAGIQIISLENVDDLQPGNNSLDYTTIDEIQFIHNVYVDENNSILYVLGSTPGNVTSFGTPQHVSSFNIHDLEEDHVNNTHGYNYIFTLKKIEGHSETDLASASNPINIGLDSAYHTNYYHDFWTYTYTDGPSAGKTYGFGANEGNGIIILDVTDPYNWITLCGDGGSITNSNLMEYQNVWPNPFGTSYLHQLCISNDGRFLFANDEFQMRNAVIVYDLDPLIQFQSNPELVTFSTGGAWTANNTTQNARNHNLYTHFINGKDYIFHSCYTEGLRVYRVDRTENSIDLEEVGFYDTYPNNNIGYQGCWSNYYWDNDNNDHLVIASDMTFGSFLLKFTYSFPESEPEPCQGDVNGDGVVNILDLLIIIENWGCSSEHCQGDVNGDGVVNILDLLIIIENWGCGL